MQVDSIMGALPQQIVGTANVGQHTGISVSAIVLQNARCEKKITWNPGFKAMAAVRFPVDQICVATLIQRLLNAGPSSTTTGSGAGMFVIQIDDLQD
jgi:hypothetical protein